MEVELAREMKASVSGAEQHALRHRTSLRDLIRQLEVLQRGGRVASHLAVQEIEERVDGARTSSHSQGAFKRFCF